MAALVDKRLLYSGNVEASRAEIISNIVSAVNSVALSESLTHMLHRLRLVFIIAFVLPASRPSNTV